MTETAKRQITHGRGLEPWETSQGGARGRLCTGFDLKMRFVAGRKEDRRCSPLQVGKKLEPQLCKLDTKLGVKVGCPTSRVNLQSWRSNFASYLSKLEIQLRKSTELWPVQFFFFKLSSNGGVWGGGVVFREEGRGRGGGRRES